MKILITGGLGFVGSSIVKSIINLQEWKNIVILDNFSTGNIKNLAGLEKHPKVTILNGDIRDIDFLSFSIDESIDCISHQAAMCSVEHSISDPLLCNAINVTGTLNVFKVAKDKKVRRVVYASSAAVYGPSNDLPLLESNKNISPTSTYGLSKLINEQYAAIFGDLDSPTSFIGLRYFNIYGPFQDPNGPYAAVIPIFIKKRLLNIAPVINGDGSFTRDFIHIEDIVHANILALLSNNLNSYNQIFNISTNTQISILDIWNTINEISQLPYIQPVFGHVRSGDIPHSFADNTKAIQMLNFYPNITFNQGVRETYDWFKDHQNHS